MGLQILSRWVLSSVFIMISITMEMYPWSYCRKKTLSGHPWMRTAQGRGGACGFTTSSPVSTAGKRDDEIPSHVGWFCSFPTLDPTRPCESTVLLQITLGTWGGQCFESRSSLLTAYIPLTMLLNWKSSGGIAGQPLPPALLLRQLGAPVCESCCRGWQGAQRTKVK